MFQLHPTLAKDTFLVGDFPLSTVRLMNDCQFPWLILVPRVSGVKEIYELSAADQVQFLRESSWTSSQMAKSFGADNECGSTWQSGFTAAFSSYCALSKRRALAKPCLGRTIRSLYR